MHPHTAIKPHVNAGVRFVDVPTTRRDQGHRQIPRVGLGKFDACRATRPLPSVDEHCRPVHEDVSGLGVLEVGTQQIQ